MPRQAQQGPRVRFLPHAHAIISDRHRASHGLSALDGSKAEPAHEEALRVERER